MPKRELLKFPNDFEATMRALLATPPAPHGTMGSRKAAPTYAYESAPVKGTRAKKKAGKKKAAAHR